MNPPFLFDSPALLQAEGALDTDISVKRDKSCCIAGGRDR